MERTPLLRESMPRSSWELQAHSTRPGHSPLVRGLDVVRSNIGFGFGWELLLGAAGIGAVTVRKGIAFGASALKVNRSKHTAPELLRVEASGQANQRVQLWIGPAQNMQNLSDTFIGSLLCLGESDLKNELISMKLESHSCLCTAICFLCALSFASNATDLTSKRVPSWPRAKACLQLICHIILQLLQAFLRWCHKGKEKNCSCSEATRATRDRWPVRVTYRHIDTPWSETRL